MMQKAGTTFPRPQTPTLRLRNGKTGTAANANCVLLAVFHVAASAIGWSDANARRQGSRSALLAPHQSRLSFSVRAFVWHGENTPSSRRSPRRPQPLPRPPPALCK